MLAFALSFDEVIVTTFTAGQQQTLPIWMFSESWCAHASAPSPTSSPSWSSRSRFLPILAAYYLTRDGEAVEGASK